MVPANTLLLIGGTMAVLMAIAGFVLTQKDAWRAILLLATLLGGMNIGIFIWSELLEGWQAFRVFLFWVTAFLPPFVGLAIGAALAMGCRTR